MLRLSTRIGGGLLAVDPLGLAVCGCLRLYEAYKEDGCERELTFSFAGQTSHSMTQALDLQSRILFLLITDDLATTSTAFMPLVEQSILT